MEQFLEREMAGETYVLWEYLLECHIDHHKSHITLRVIEPRSPRWEDGD
jgi:hypothetical protein